MIDIGKSKKTKRKDCLNLSLNEQILKEFGSFKYLGSVMDKNKCAVEDLITRVNKGAEVSGTMNRIWKVRSLCVNV